MINWKEAILLMNVLSIVITLGILLISSDSSLEYKQWRMKRERSIPKIATNVKDIGNGWTQYELHGKKYMQTSDFYGGHTVVELK